MIMFTLPPRRQAIPTIAGPLAAARYLTLRREAAGLSRIQVAQLLTRRHIRHPHGDRSERAAAYNREEALALVDQLETAGTKARYRETIEILGSIFALDADVYFQLANEPADRHPAVCRGCGCSDSDTCIGTGGVCSWMTPHSCSRCVDRDLETVEQR